MKKLIRTAALALLGVAASGALASAAMAQDSVTSSALATASITQSEGFVVTGRPFISHIQKVGRRAGDVTMSLQRSVSYRDLDLRRRDDVDELWRRIDSAAVGLCQALESEFPDGVEPGHGCVPEAVDGTTGQVDGAVSRATR